MDDMGSIYDEVHREAMADRHNGFDEVEPDRPDPAEYVEPHRHHGLVTPRYREFLYEPGPNDPF
jgi:hypothetical protein